MLTAAVSPAPILARYNYAQNYDHPVHFGTTRRYYQNPVKAPHLAQRK
jgi:hypothetical protein